MNIKFWITLIEEENWNFISVDSVAIHSFIIEPVFTAQYTRGDPKVLIVTL